MINPIVLSGGSGTRLWPLSRKAHPKQLLPLLNETSLLEDTINRLQGLGDVDKTWLYVKDIGLWLLSKCAQTVWVRMRLS